MAMPSPAAAALMISHSDVGIRGKRSVASELEGALLISRSCFPYFMLIALEAGGPLRALLLLSVSPLLWLFDLIGFQDMALRLMIFVSTVGVGVANVEAAAKATLMRFYLEDLREGAYKVFSGCGGKKYVVTSMPRVLVEPFLTQYLDVDHVIGTELMVLSGCCLGLAASPGLMLGLRRFQALKAALGDSDLQIDLGIGMGDDALIRDHPFMLLCREIQLIPPDEKAFPLARRDYPKPLIFHDGRLVAPPTPLDSLAVLLWSPLGIVLAISRILIGVLAPYKLAPLGSAATGVRIRAQLFPSSSRDQSQSCGRGTLYVCSHRTLLDPVFISTALQRRVSAVTYSLSRFSELISPIPTVRLSRNRMKDGEKMHALLEHGDLVVCPEGTTCREPYLLRFSPLFAEIADDIVPVAVMAEGSMFYGTTVRGYKCLDSFFFLMNPSPCYSLRFLEPLSGPPGDCTSSTSSCDVANHVQRSIGGVLGFECTNLTRRDKYRMLAGHDGVCVDTHTKR